MNLAPIQVHHNNRMKIMKFGIFSCFTRNCLRAATEPSTIFDRHTPLITIHFAILTKKTHTAQILKWLTMMSIGKCKSNQNHENPCQWQNEFILKPVMYYDLRQVCISLEFTVTEPFKMAIQKSIFPKYFPGIFGLINSQKY